jgi:hypothetical protein
LIAQLTSANAAQYSVVFFICHIQSPFSTGFAASASGGSGDRFSGSNRSSLNSRQAIINGNKQIKEKRSLIQPG